MHEQWEREVREELRGIVSAMADSLGVRVRFKLDANRLAAGQAVPKFITPARLADYAPTSSVSLAPSAERMAGKARDGKIARLGEQWHKHRDVRPELWSFSACMWQGIQ